MPKPLARPYADLESQYTEQIERLFNQINREFIAALKKTMAEEDVDSAIIRKVKLNAFKDIFERFQKLAGKLRTSYHVQSTIGRMKILFENTDKRVKKVIAGTYKRAGRELPVLKLKEPSKALEESVQRNVELIKNITEEHVESLKNAVFHSMRQGFDLEVIQDEVLKQANKGLEYAKFVSRDQLAKAHADINEERQRSVGIDGYIWIVTNDSKARMSHREHHNKFYTWDNPPVINFALDGQKRAPERLHPGHDYQCVIGSNKVFINSNLVRCFRRKYTGILTKIVSSSGRSFTVTPNHPIFTSRGFIAANLIQKGDNIVEIPNEIIDIRENNITNREISAEEIFNSFALRFPVKRVGGFRSQFHGDGSDEEVDIITINGGLWNKFNFIFNKQIRKFFFSCSNQMFIRIFKSKFSKFFLMFIGLWNPFAGFISGLSKFKSFILAKFTHSDKICFRNIPSFNSIFFKNSGNNIPGNIDFFRNGKLANSRGVLTDNEIIVEEKFITGIVDISHVEYSGYVYNFETESNIYWIDRIASHNCRCIGVPAFSDDVELSERIRGREYGG